MGVMERGRMLPVAAALLVLVVAALIVAGLRAGAARAGLSGGAFAVRASAVIATLLGLSGLAAASGWTSDFEARPPHLMLVVATSVLTFGVATRGAAFRRVLRSTPRAWPIAIQTMRVPIELGLWALWAAGRLPVHLTFHGRNLDVLVGLTAPIVAWAVHRDHLSRGAAIAWNVGSLAFLANVVGMAITSIPGPLRLDWPGEPNLVVAELPFVWLPAFLVPVALFGHVLSLRQLLGSGAGRRSDLSQGEPESE